MAIGPFACLEAGRLFENAVCPGLKSNPGRWPGATNRSFQWDRVSGIGKPTHLHRGLELL